MSSSPNSSSSTELDAAALAPLEDATCDVDVVLGSGTITVRDCLGLRRQMVIRLQQAAGSDLQVLVNGVGVAQGEVVIIDDSTAIRLTEITPPKVESRP